MLLYANRVSSSSNIFPESRSAKTANISSTINSKVTSNNRSIPIYYEENDHKQSKEQGISQIAARAVSYAVLPEPHDCAIFSKTIRK